MAKRCPFPLDGPLAGRVLMVGGIYVDLLNEVPTFPKEDTSQRAVTFKRSRGGNAANSSVVLAELLAAAKADCRVSWVGAVPSLVETDTAFALADLQRHGVETSLLEEVGGGTGQPTSFIIVSADTGARTIISHRRGLRELDPAHFAAALRRTPGQAAALGEPCWVHLECRLMPDVLRMGEAFSVWAPAEGRPVLSLEVEKPGLQPEQLLPLLRLSDVTFFSREFIETHEAALLQRGGGGGAQGGEMDDHLALRCLRGLRAWVGDGCSLLWICAWGALGAFALDCATGKSSFQPAQKVQVVSSVGAGDTFVASCIYALLRGADAPLTLQCGCKVAGHKVAQEGLDGLAVAAPSSLAEGGSGAKRRRIT